MDEDEDANERLSLGDTARVHIILMIIVSVNRELLYTYIANKMLRKEEKLYKKRKSKGNKRKS